MLYIPHFEAGSIEVCIGEFPQVRLWSQVIGTHRDPNGPTSTGDTRRPSKPKQGTEVTKV